MNERPIHKRLQHWGWVGLIALMASVLVLAAACGGDDEQQEQQAAPAAAAAPAAQAEQQQADEPAAAQQQQEAPAAAEAKTGVVRIGSVQPLSGGGLAFYGKSEEAGLLLAVEQINAAGGFVVGDTTYTIEVVRRDGRSEDAVAIAAVQELIRDEGSRSSSVPCRTAQALRPPRSASRPRCFT